MAKQKFPHVLLRSNVGVECRICGFLFVPESAEDRKQDRTNHKNILKGGIPLDVREFLKGFGWAVAHNGGGINRLKFQMEGEHHRETAKRAVVYAWWCRARANGLPNRELEEYMDAHFAFVDAMIDKDQARIDDASQLIKRWEHLAG